MSQKTNCLSLRLQNGNQNFISPWFTDFFFSDNFQHEIEVSKYLGALLKESQYSKAFISTKSDYRKFNILLGIQDIRGERKEKQLLFKVSSKMGPTKKVTVIDSKKARSQFLRSLYQQKKWDQLQIENSLLEKSFTVNQDKQNNDFNASLSNQDRFISNQRKNIVKSLQKVVNQPTQLLSNKISKLFSKKENNDFCLVNNKNKAFSLLFKKRLVDHFLKQKQNYNNHNLFNHNNLQKSHSISIPFRRDYDYDAFDNVNKSNTEVESSYNRKTSNFSFFRSRLCLRQPSLEAFNNIVLQSNTKSIKKSDTKAMPSARLGLATINEMAKSKKSNSKQLFPLMEKNIFFLCNSFDFPFSFSRNEIDKHFQINDDDFFYKNLCLVSKLIDQNYNNQEKRVISESKQNEIVTTLPFYNNKVVTTVIEPIRFIRSTQNQFALLDIIVVLLEKNKSFRETKEKLFQEFSKSSSLKGVRISCSGRLGGRSKKAQKAKMQSCQWGSTSLNTFSSKVLFANKSANTSYGKVGVKVWLSFKDNPRPN